jgi:hypothetical protein
MNKKITVLGVILIITAANLVITTNLSAKNAPKKHLSLYKLPNIPLLDAQELKALSEKQPEVGAVGTVLFTATEQETTDMICTLNTPKQCYAGFPEERAKEAGWTFHPTNTFKRNELVLVPYEYTKYIIGAVLHDESGNDATYPVQINTNQVVYIPTHNLGKTTPELKKSNQGGIKK